MDYKNLISKGKILKVIIFPDFWIEEATELEEEDFQQLTLRLRGLTDSYKQITLKRITGFTRSFLRTITLTHITDYITV